MTDQLSAFDRRRGVGERTALYRLYDAADTLLYVGITKNTARRWFQHSQTKHWWRRVARREVEWLSSRPSALLAERRAILSEKPLHNPPNPSHQPGPRLVTERADASAIAAELVAAQEAVDTAKQAQIRRQDAVVKAQAAGWSKYRIAQVLGVKGPTVDSILEAVKRRRSKPSQEEAR